MHPRWIAIARVAVVFAAAGWLAGAMVLATDADRALPETFLDGAALRSALAGLLSGIAWGPALGWPRVRWWAAAPIGVVAGLTALYLFFFLWPHAWQPSRLDAWKAAGLFGKVYWKLLVPLSVGAALLSALWTRRIAWHGWRDGTEDP